LVNAGQQRLLMYLTKFMEAKFLCLMMKNIL